MLLFDGLWDRRQRGLECLRGYDVMTETNIPIRFD